MPQFDVLSPRWQGQFRMASRGDITAWTREILRLPQDAPVHVVIGPRRVAITAGGRSVSFEVAAASLAWVHLARALLPLRASCADPDE